MHLPRLRRRRVSAVSVLGLGCVFAAASAPAAGAGVGAFGARYGARHAGAARQLDSEIAEVRALLGAASVMAGSTEVEAGDDGEGEGEGLGVGFGVRANLGGVERQEVIEEWGQVGEIEGGELEGPDGGGEGEGEGEGAGEMTASGEATMPQSTDAVAVGMTPVAPDANAQLEAVVGEEENTETGEPVPAVEYIAEGANDDGVENDVDSDGQPNGVVGSSNGGEAGVGGDENQQDIGEEPSQWTPNGGDGGNGGGDGGGGDGGGGDGGGGDGGGGDGGGDGGGGDTAHNSDGEHGENDNEGNIVEGGDLEGEQVDPDDEGDTSGSIADNDKTEDEGSGKDSTPGLAAGLGAICVAGVISGIIALHARRARNSDQSASSGRKNIASGKARRASFDSVIIDGSSNPSDWRDLGSLEENYLSSPSPVLASVLPVTTSQTMKEKGNKGNLVDWVFKNGSGRDTLSQGSSIPWSIRRSFQSSSLRDASLPDIVSQHTTGTEDTKFDFGDRSRGKALEASIYGSGMGKAAAVVPLHEADSTGSIAQTRMQDTLRQVNNSTHLRQRGGKKDMHLAVILDASSAFSEEDYNGIKSMLFNTKDGLFDRVAQEVPGEFTCSYIQYANHSSASTATDYNDMTSGKMSVLTDHEWCGKECWGREIHLALNRCLSQLRGYGRTASTEMRRAVIISGGPVTENGSSSTAGFAALESARALHADGVPVVMIDFSTSESREEGIASGDPPLYFSVDSVLGFQLVTAPLAKLIGSIHLTTQTYRSTADFNSAIG